MAVEIERKFLLSNSRWRDQVYSKKTIVQGYLSQAPEKTVRIRISNERGIITIKGKSEGNSRLEFEYPIPLNDAKQLIKLCVQPVIEKQRHLVKHGTKTWEIDEFLGENKGLLLAEIELETSDEPIDLPEWIGREVSHDRRYFNASLATHPYCRWAEAEAH